MTETMDKLANDLEYLYDDDSIDIHDSTFDKDFDEVGWEPEVVDDSDEEAAEMFGF